MVGGRVARQSPRPPHYGHRSTKPRVIVIREDPLLLNYHSTSISTIASRPRSTTSVVGATVMNEGILTSVAVVSARALATTRWWFSWCEILALGSNGTQVAYVTDAGVAYLLRPAERRYHES